MVVARADRGPVQRHGSEEGMTNFIEDGAVFVREMKQQQVRHKLRLILMSRRYFFQFGSREAARRVTQELFDLAFAPGELDVLAEVK